MICRSFLSLVFAVATTRNTVSARIELGSLFGANWDEIETILRNNFVASLTDAHTICAPEAVCPTHIGTFCGYYESINEPSSPFRKLQKKDEFVDLEIMEVQQDVRQMLEPQCQQSFGYECYLEFCFESCFEGSRKNLSNECKKSIVVVKDSFDLLKKQEDSDDNREKFFRFAVMVMALLSAVEGLFVVFLISPKFEEEVAVTSWCGKFCTMSNFIIINVLLVGLFAARISPLFLIVIIAPFIMVQMVYYVCFNERPAQEPITVTVLPIPTAFIPMQPQEACCY